MNWEIAVTLLTVLMLFVGFVRQFAEAEVLALAAASLLLLCGILTIEDLLGVFSNPAAMTVAAMFVLSAALEKTGTINTLGRAAIQLAEWNVTIALGSMFAAVFLASFFINNTSVVLITIPVIIMLAKRMQINTSKLLMPLSYISILGGTCTLIGTSTNLLVADIASQMGLARFSMFEMLVPGLVMAACGALYLLLIGRRLLPERETLSMQFEDISERNYMSQVSIAKGSALIGKTLAESGFTRSKDYEILQHIPAEAEHSRSSQLMTRIGAERRMLQKKMHKDALKRFVDMDVVLKEGDRFVIVSNQRNILEAVKDSGVVDEALVSDDVITLEGIIAPGSGLIGRNVENFNRSRRYRAHIIAVYRHNGAISSDFSKVRLAVGDSILLRGEEAGLSRLFADDHLINLTRPQLEPYNKKHAPIAFALLALAIGLATFNMLPIAAGAFAAAVLVILSGCIKMKDAYEALQGNVLLLIYAMLAISVAMEKTGALQFIVSGLMVVIKDLPPVMVISILYLLTSFITEIFSNNAAAVMLTPIAIGLAISMGVDPRPFAVAVMFAASASFATPIGYQTNLLVYSAGGYHFNDFLKAGVPMNILMWLVASFVIPIYWGL
jgi:di/tricarboxylate transporter